MTIKQRAPFYILLCIWLFAMDTSFACSMYKVTAYGKTLVGNNEDSWGRDPKVWFIKSTKDKFGVVCVGYARKYPNPDGAMNEHGLAFDAFTMRRKGNLPARDTSKNDFAYSHILTIMQQCKTVDEVYFFLSKLNLHILDGSPLFNGGMFLFVDKAGKYLVVEADTMTLGNDDKYALANFSVSDTKDLSTIKTERYCKGVTFLNNKPLDTSLSYFNALSDTMSVNRPKVGDGTLYTSIYDLTDGLVHLNFFHDFSKTVTFNLQEELAKGDHSYNMVDLFPDNSKFQAFLNYKTPQNNKAIFSFLVVSGFLFLFSSVYFLTGFLRSSQIAYRPLKLGMSVLSIFMSIYVYVLLRNEPIFYFPSPYVDASSLLITLSSYLPIVLLCLIIPLILVVIKLFRHRVWNRFARFILLLNGFCLLVLIGLFGYWKLFDILS